MCYSNCSLGNFWLEGAWWFPIYFIDILRDLLWFECKRINTTWRIKNVVNITGNTLRCNFLMNFGYTCVIPVFDNCSSVTSLIQVTVIRLLSKVFCRIQKTKRNPYKCKDIYDINIVIYIYISLKPDQSYSYMYYTSSQFLSI